MGAAAVDAVLVPGPGVHEGLDEETEGVALLHLETVQDLAELGVLAAALDQVGKLVAHLVAQEALEAGEVDELGDAPDADRRAQQVADGRAVRIAAGQRREVLEAQPAGRLLHRAEDDVGGIQPLRRGRGPPAC